MTTRALTTTYASTVSRLFALLVDGLLFGIIVGVFYRLIGNPNINGVIDFVVGAGLQIYFLTRYNGQTPGKMLLGIRVVKTDGSPLTGSDAFVRYLGYALNWLSLGVGWLWVFFDEDRQGWHDKLARTYVVKV